MSRSPLLASLSDSLAMPCRRPGLSAPYVVSGVAALVVAALAAGIAPAQLTIDPDATGAADVTFGETLLVNPLPAVLVDPTAFVRIGYPGDGAVEVAGGSYVQSGGVRIGAGTVVSGLLRITDAGSLWQISEGGRDLEVNGPDAFLHLLAGGQIHVDDDATFGSGSTTRGIGWVDGVGSRLLVGDELHIGKSGVGIIDVSNGGAIEADDLILGDSSFGNGTLLATGADSLIQVDSWVEVGARGNGILNLSDQARGESRYLDIGGSLADKFASTQLTGAGTEWEASSYIRVSGGETAGLTIEEGAAATTSTLYVGSSYNQSGAVLVRGAGSMLTATGVSYIGSSGVGELNVRLGGQAQGGNAYVGRHDDATGNIVVQDPGSQWTVQDLYLGDEGAGTLTVAENGAVSARDVWLGRDGGLGVIELGSGGSVSARSLAAAPGDLHGMGTIATGGLVSDVDLAFDATHPAQQQVVFDQLPDQDVTVQLDVSQEGALGAGYRGHATLRIADNADPLSSMGILGWHEGSTGEATIEGATWRIRGDLYVGRSGVGKLDIIDGTVVAIEIVQVGPDGLSRVWLDHGTLDAGALVASPTALQGQGVVEAGGLLTDLDLVFDAAAPPTQVFHLHGPAGQGVELRYNYTPGQLLGVGHTATGSLTVRDGRLIETGETTLGLRPDSQGTADVAGSGSRLQVNDDLTIGDAGVGVMQVAEGATLYAAGTTRVGASAGSHGQLEVVGAGSTLLAPATDSFSPAYVTVGDAGTGLLGIRDGAMASVGGLSIGSSSGGDGLVEVSGLGSRLETTMTPSSFSSTPLGIVVGDQGRGRLYVSGGAQVTTSTLLAANSSYPFVSGLSAQIVVTGPGSRLEVAAPQGASTYDSTAGAIVMGGSSVSEMWITDGGFVRARRATLGEYEVPVADRRAIVHVRGVGSAWHVGSLATVTSPIFDPDLLVGGGSPGQIIVSDGGVLLSGPAKIDRSPRPRSGPAVPQNEVVVTGAGSRWETAPTDLFSPSVLSLTVDDYSRLTITEGGFVRSGNALVNGGIVTVNDAAWHVAGTLATHAGSDFHIAPGGLIDVDYELQVVGSQPSFKFEFGADLASAGSLKVDGSIFASAIRIDPAAGDEFSAAVGDRITLATHAESRYSSVAVSSEFYGGNRIWGYSLDGQLTSLALQIESVAWAADFNGSGAVDADDLAIWKGNVGRSGVNLHNLGDANLDGRVDGADFLSWQRAFGKSLAGAATGVPEPASAALALLGLVAIGRWRNGQRRRPR